MPFAFAPAAEAPRAGVRTEEEAGTGEAGGTRRRKPSPATVAAAAAAQVPIVTAIGHSPVFRPIASGG